MMSLNFDQSWGLTLSCYYGHQYILLTEFEVRTVSYGPSFFPFDLSRAGHIIGEKTRIRNLQYGWRKHG